MSGTSKHDERGNRSSLDKSETVHLEHVTDVATHEDHSMTPWQCIARNPKIVAWTLYANMGSTLVGYENLALSVCLALPAFQMRFASEVHGELIIPAYWQSLWNALFNVSQLLGSISAGYIQDKLGRRAVFLLAAVIASAGIAVAYISKTPPQFLAAKIVVGIAAGQLLTATQTYVSEITPLPMRGIALACNILMLNVGFLIAICTTFSRVSIMDDSAFRVVFAAAWTFPAILILGLPFLPESPYWLVMKKNTEAALKHLKKLSPADEDCNAQVAAIQETIETETLVASESASFVECFQGDNWRRTRIIMICMYMPQVAGATLSSNAPYFLNQTGLNSHTVVMLTQISCAIGVLSGIVNLFVMMRFRHRPLMFFGMSCCSIVYLIMGVAACVPQSQATLMAIGVSLQFVSLSYGPSIGSAMAVAGEVSASRLRAQSQGLAFAFQATVSTIWTIVLPYMFNRDQANMGGHIGWVFFGMTVIMIVTVYFVVPGTKGRSFRELDEMFGMKIPARHFERYKFD